MTRRRRRVTRDEFVRIWQGARTLAEAALECGMSKKTASVRATYYRGRGVDLKEFDNSLDVEALNAVAVRHAPPRRKP